jgi:predicted transposase/invertase (TIGR01784 family)
MTEKKKVNNNVKSHDRFFKKSMSYPEIAHEFFKSYLPKEVLEIIDLSTLKQESSSFLSNELGEGVSDVLYSVKYGEESGYISILLEHQSTSDRLITFRIQKYMLRLCEEHLRKQKGKKNSEKTLPNIYPVILYTGNKKYTAPRSFYELFENEELAKKFFTEPVKVIDVHEIKDEELKERYLDTMMYIMRHIYAKDILKYIIRKIVNFEIIAKNNFSYLEDMLVYIIEKGESEDTKELLSVFQEIVPQEKIGNIMTIAERLATSGPIADKIREQSMKAGMEAGMEAGMQKGKLEGKLEIAKKMLSEGILDKKMIANITELDLSEIEKLAN